MPNKSFSEILTFSRGSEGTYFDSEGVLQTAGVDEERLTHDPATGEPQGLLVEEERTNVLLNSDAPATQTVTVSDATTYTLSVIGDGSAEITQGGSGTASEGSPLTFVTTGTTVEVTVSGSLDYFQLEQASTASSMIITGSTAVTRAADVVSQDEVDKWFNPLNFTLYLEGVIRESSVAQVIAAVGENVSNRIQFNVFAGGDFSVELNLGGSKTEFNTTDNYGFYKAVISVSNGNATFTLNGVSSSKAIEVSNPDFSNSILQIGDRGNTGIGSSFPSSGTYSDLYTLPYALTESEAKALTQPEE